MGPRTCEVCEQRSVSCRVGVVRDLESVPRSTRVTCPRRDVKYACRQCATEYVENEYGREMPLDEGDAWEVWRSDRIALTNDIGQVTAQSRFVITQSDAR